MSFTRRTMLGAAAAAAAMPSRAATGALLPGVRIAPDREAMVAVPGGRVYVRVNGDLAARRPPIVLLHGGPGSTHWYFLNATALADERAVILYDQLDGGRSDRPGDPANWRVPRFVDELEAVRGALGVERWHVLGASWGGTIVLEHAAARPKSLASAIIQSPLVATDAWLADARRLIATMPPATRRLLVACDTPGAAPQAACDAATEAFYARYVMRAAPPPAIAAYRATLKRGEAIYTHMWGRAEFTASGTLKTYDGRPLLTRLDPERTLFVTGEHDEATPATIAGFARAAGAPFKVIPGAAHVAMNDSPAAYLAILRPWLRAHD